MTMKKEFMVKYATAGELMKAAIKREQCHACMSDAEREQARTLLKEEVKAIVKEAEEGRVQLEEAVERLAAQIDECAKSQAVLKKSIQKLKERVS